MPTVVGVAFRPVTKVYYFDPLELTDLQPDEAVVVETSRGRTLGRVVFAPREVSDKELSGSLKPVVRRATAWDMVQADQMVHREGEAQAIAVERARALGANPAVREKLARVMNSGDVREGPTSGAEPAGEGDRAGNRVDSAGSVSSP